MNNVLETHELTYYYKDFKALDSLSLEVPKGSIYGFLGPNGAGKSTTIKTILGLYGSKREKISVFGKYLKEDREAILTKIGALIESPSLYSHLSAEDNLKIICKLRNINPSNIFTILKEVGLGDTNKKKVGAFSTGMKQRLGLAIALIPEPELLILDEPTNGLDPQGMKEFREILTILNKKRNVTVFISSHLLHEIEKFVTHVGIINKGKLIFQDTINKLRELNMSKVIFETGDSLNSISLLNKEGYVTEELYSGSFSVDIKDKQEIAKISRLLFEKNISIFEMRSSGKNLEELFFGMMKGDKYEK